MTIALTGVEVDAAGEVLVCGGGASLGDWDAAHAVRMTRDGDAWLASLSASPDATLTFKFLQRRPDGELIWEAGDNRTAAAAGRIDATWR
ncbi:MAG: hypothetical protein H6708_17735 [Kofleriaceae bacterium]|nr:hypothetical protein [Kofleriaceae bacterium]